MSEADTDTYALKAAVLPEIPAPDLAYKPPAPTSYRPRIALIGAGGIAASHLDAYRTGGLGVVPSPPHPLQGRGEARKILDPDAVTTDDWRRGLLADPGIDVVRYPHPYPSARACRCWRLPSMAGKHVSQPGSPSSPISTTRERPGAAGGGAGRELARQPERPLVAAYGLDGARRCCAGLMAILVSAHVNIRLEPRLDRGHRFREDRRPCPLRFRGHTGSTFVTSLAPGPHTAPSWASSTRRHSARTALPPLLAQALRASDGAQASLCLRRRPPPTAP